MINPRIIEIYELDYSRDTPIERETTITERPFKTPEDESVTTEKEISEELPYSAIDWACM